MIPTIVCIWTTFLKFKSYDIKHFEICEFNFGNDFKKVGCKKSGGFLDDYNNE